MTYKSSLSYVHLIDFSQITALDLVNFTDGSFSDFFQYTCRYCADFWHVSLLPAFLKAIHTKTDKFLYLKGGLSDLRTKLLQKH